MRGKNPKKVWSEEADIDDLHRYLTKIRSGKGTALCRFYLHQVWSKLRMVWGVPEKQTIDEFVMDELEGRGHKFVREHRFIETRY